MRKFAVLGTLALALAPSISLAQGLGDIEGSAGVLQNIVNALIPVAFGLAILFFFWGLAKYILAAGDEERKKEGRSIMIWGVIALFVMVAIWGLVAFIGDIFGVDTERQLQAPNINLPDANL